MKNIQLAVKLFLVAATLVTFSCKKDDSTDSNPEARLPKNTGVTVITALNDYSGDSITYKVGSLKLVSLKNDSFSKNISTIAGTRKFSFAVNGQTKEFEITIDSNETYTAIVYGSASNPKFYLASNDSLGTISVPETKFKYRFFNAYDSSGVSNISCQAYYPSYSLWATTVGTAEYIPYGSFCKFAEYTANVEVSWRIVESGTEGAVVMGGYRPSSTNPFYTPTTKLKGAPGKHHTFIIYGKNATVKHLEIVHEDL